VAGLACIMPPASSTPFLQHEGSPSCYCCLAPRNPRLHMVYASLCYMDDSAWQACV